MIFPHPKKSYYNRVPYVKVFKRAVAYRNRRYLYQWRFQIRAANHKVIASASKLNSKQAVSHAIWIINPALPVVWP